MVLVGEMRALGRNEGLGELLGLVLVVLHVGGLRKGLLHLRPLRLRGVLKQLVGLRGVLDQLLVDWLVQLLLHGLRGDVLQRNLRREPRVWRMVGVAGVAEGGVSRV